MIAVSHKVVCLTIGILSVTASAQAQSVDKIIDRHIEAIGGRKILDQITSTAVTGVVTSDDGRKGRFTRQAKRPHLLYVDMSWDDGRWSSAFNGRSAWERDQRGGTRTLSGVAAARARAEAIEANNRVLATGPTTRMVLQGRDEVRGRPVFVLVAATADGFRRTLSIDAETYLILKEEQQTEAGPDVRTFDDYRRVDQVMEPHRIEWRRGDQRLLITIERVTHNTTLDDRVFDAIPTSEASPNVRGLLDAVRRNQQQLEERLQSYTYLQTRIDRELDDQGRVKKEEVRVFEVFYLAGQPVRKLVTQNGQALSPNDKRREGERVSAIVRDYEERRARQARSGDDRPVVPNLGPRQPPSEARWISAYLRMSHLLSPRREPVQGRPVIVVEFEPMAGAVARDAIESQVGKSAGVLWIDEQAQQVIRLDSYFLDDDNAIVRGSSVLTEQTMIDGDVWLPSHSEANVASELFFGKRLRRQLLFRFSDYRKFNVDSDFDVKLPESKP